MRQQTVQTSESENAYEFDSHMENDLMSYSRTRWIRRLMALTALLLLLAVAPAQSSRAQKPHRRAAEPYARLDGPARSRPIAGQIQRPRCASATAATLAAQTGLAVQDTIPQLGIAVVEAPEAGTNAELAATAAALEASPAVEWAEPNYTFTLDATPNDPYYPTNQAPYLNRLEMPAAWDYTTGQSDVIIAVLDTGVDMNHPDLASGIWTNPREIPDNGIDDDGNGFIDDVHGWNFADGNNPSADDYGHGTHVAGSRPRASTTAIGIAGMAGGATIMPVEVFFPRQRVGRTKI